MGKLFRKQHTRETDNINTYSSALHAFRKAVRYL
ncbi:hypothetical protein KPSA3_01480 [Pseudomonas syringae pv. actinidiae]|uniref:Uncharacterized protein n=1 Tax=Pseudomonas syringae pv. actinidiae TaxID=103796 RepID=A0AAN4Q1N1_PSESF|nr:hypothetical protein KPSA3_01480 [Pseudomonas syringae pv. actinidiae]